MQVFENIKTYDSRISEFKRLQNADFMLKLDAVKFKVFSDNFVFVTEMADEHKKNYTYIKDLIRCVANIQLILLNIYNTFIRGALVIGNIYVSPIHVFGSGLIKAYSLENSIAIFPRIILDEQCYTLLTDGGKQDDMITDDLVVEDIDGNYFISYLPRANAEFDRVLFEDNYKMHYEKITYALKNTTNQRVLQKYHWCKSYHNRMCRLNGYEKYIID